jgi:post-segregation antitoxin (ccd killing protein)
MAYVTSPNATVRLYDSNGTMVMEFEASNVTINDDTVRYTRTVNIDVSEADKEKVYKKLSFKGVDVNEQVSYLSGRV